MCLKGKGIVAHRCVWMPVDSVRVHHSSSRTCAAATPALLQRPPHPYHRQGGRRRVACAARSHCAGEAGLPRQQLYQVRLAGHGCCRCHCCCGRRGFCRCCCCWYHRCCCLNPCCCCWCCWCALRCLRKGCSQHCACWTGYSAVSVTPNAPSCAVWRRARRKRVQATAGAAAPPNNAAVLPSHGPCLRDAPPPRTGRFLKAFI